MIKELTERYPVLKESEKAIEDALKLMADCFGSGGKLLLCGNGGSAADCEHIAGELCKGFMKKRPLSETKKQEMKANCSGLTEEILLKLQRGYPAIPLSSMTALNTAFSNDVDPKLIYAQGVLALAKQNDVLFAISTSGNSENTVAAAMVARGLGVKVIALTGKGGGELGELADVCISVGEEETYKVQELHLPVYHYLCRTVEEYLE